MNPKGNKGIGIDLSGHILNLVVVEKRGKEVTLTHYRSVALPPDIPSREERNAALRDGLMRLAQGIDLRKGILVIGLGGQSAFVRKMKLPPVPPNRLKQIVIYEVQQQIPFPLKEVVWDYYIPPVGKKESQAMEVVMAAIKSEMVENYVEQVRLALGKDPDIVEVSVLSLHNSLVYNEILEEDLVSLVISVGWNSTDILIEEGRNLAFSRSLPLGERNMLRAIMNSRGVDYSEARDILLKESPPEARGVWEDLVTEIKRTMNYYLSQVERVTSFDEILVQGWISQHPEFMGFLSSRFSSSVRGVDPWRKISRPPGLTNGYFSATLGLALRPVSEVSLEINLLPPPVVKKKIMERKKPYFILSGILIPFVGATFSAFSYQDYTITRLKLERVKKVVESFQPYIPKIKELSKKRREIEGKLHQVYSILSRKTFWSDLFMEISRLTPSDTYIVSFRRGEVIGEKRGSRE